MTNVLVAPVAERYRFGKKLRRKTPREGHADLLGPSDRDPVKILEAEDRKRLPELLPLRYERMLQNPFAFFRGAAAVMVHDLKYQQSPGILVQACGDCHLMNFGAFTTPEENVIFDINDFDETLPGIDFTVDLKRLTASVAVAALGAEVSKSGARAMAAATAKAYRERILALAKLSPLQVWRSRVDLAEEINRIKGRSLKRQLGATLAKAAGCLEDDDNFPHLVKGQRPRIADRPQLIFHFTKASDAYHRLAAEAVFSSYYNRLTPAMRCLIDRYQLKDIAFKVVGVGSVGTFCAVGLFVSGCGAPLFLQIKEACRSVLERLGPKYNGHQGRRVVEGQRVMQAASDMLLGWTEDEVAGRTFYVRHLKNRRLGSIGEVEERQALLDYSRLCGRTLARAHARSADPVVIAGYVGRGKVMDDALASFAMAYAARTRTDHARLLQAKGQKG